MNALTKFVILFLQKSTIMMTQAISYPVKKPWFVLLLLSFYTSCNTGDHFISDSQYRHKVSGQFEAAKDLAKNRSEQLFGVFDQRLTLQEKEALEFLYAYMPLSDLADYDGEFYLKNVRTTLAIRDTFSWGKTIPEEIFRHFVLPVRVNNENLDSSRWLFFAELKDRVKRLSMKDAALEVNHWCHEKVTYRGTDIRTSSPLATVRTAYGRCGEESTFTTAALRAVGIPARQCYTPRWAHTDDNHAWVEVWIDGKWHYMGACEPEPALDLAWFTDPAKRAMLVNTNVFGEYEGPEDILVKDPRFTRINILPNYTDTKRIFVKVTGPDRKPVDSAQVEFQLYNYAEFYALTKCFTGPDGKCSFLTGYGDLLVWAAKNDEYGFKKVSAGGTDTIILVLSDKSGKPGFITFDLVPPPEKKAESIVSDSLRKINSERLAFEDKIRANYEQAFIDSSKSYRLAGNLHLNADTLWYLLKASRGNWRTILQFISDVPDEKKMLIFPLLDVISEKDLHDMTQEALMDHVVFAENKGSAKDIFQDYILNPRIDNEWVKPYKKYFRESFDEKFRNEAFADPLKIAAWVKNNIRTDNSANYGRAPLTPVGSFEMKISDPHSRDILFVALCRSFSVPARLEPATKVPQYYHDGKWKDAIFENGQKGEEKKGFITLVNDPKNGRVPEYYVHFTIERFGDGFFRSLDYETDPQLKKFPCTIEVPAGFYLLVTGNRIEGGTVLAGLEFFNVEKANTIQKTITLRKNLLPSEKYGKADLKAFLDLSGMRKACSLTESKGMILAWLEPGKEPTRHLIAELKEKKQKFSKWTGTIVFFLPDERSMSGFIDKNGRDLPGNISYSVNFTETLGFFLNALHHAGTPGLPVVMYVDPQGGIGYFSEGYRIGFAGQLMEFLK